MKYKTTAMIDHDLRQHHKKLFWQQVVMIGSIIGLNAILLWVLTCGC